MKPIIMCAAASLVLAGCGGSVSSSSSNSKELKQIDFGDEWPLTVDSGTVSCENDGQVIFKVGDKKYAVNGPAMAQQPELRDIIEIWADNPDMPGKKISIDSFTDSGLDLC